MTRRPHALALHILLLALQVLMVGCAREEAPPRPDVILITWDTVRADRVGRPEVTPTLARLMREGVSWEGARTTAPITLPAHASLLTGLRPDHHGVHTNGIQRLGSEVPLLSAHLKAAGWRTGAFVSSTVLDGAFGLARGFDAYDDKVSSGRSGPEGETRRPGAATTSAALSWAASLPADAPMFLWLHLYDAHRPWDYAPSPGGPADPYDRGIAVADHQTARLLDGLASMGRLPRSLVLITADHGESLGEHGEETHAYFAYDATLRIPMTLWAGAQAGITVAPGARVKAPVSLMDVPATLTDLLRLPALTGDGRSLAESARTGAEPPRVEIPFESANPAWEYGTAPLFGVLDVEGQAWIDAPLRERYQLDGDPGQLTNLYADADAADAAALFARHARRWPPARSGGDIDAELTAQLMALGYTSVDQDLVVPAGGYPESQDPKRRLDLLHFCIGAASSATPGVELERAADLRARYGDITCVARVEVWLLERAGRWDDATVALRALVERTEGKEAADKMIAQRQAVRASDEALVEAVSRAVAADPTRKDVYYDLGLAQRRVGRLPEARVALEEALRRAPTDDGARLLLVKTLAGLGESQAAIDAALGGPARPQVPLELLCFAGRLEVATGQTAAAVEALRGCQAQGGTLSPEERALLAKADAPP